MLLLTSFAGLTIPLIFGATGAGFARLLFIPALLAALWYGRKAVVMIAPIWLAMMVIESAGEGLATQAVLLDGAILLLMAGGAVIIADRKETKAEAMAAEAEELKGRCEEQARNADRTRELYYNQKIQCDLLLKENAEMARVVEFYPDAMLIIDSEGKVVAWNKAMEELTGVPEEEMLGRGNMEYSIPLYGYRRPMLLNLLDMGEELLRQNYQDIIRHPDGVIEARSFKGKALGKESLYHARACLLFDVSGNRIGAIESVRDVTGQRQLEERLQGQYAELSVQNEELQQQEEDLAIANNELNTLYQQLRKSERMFRSYIEQSSEGMVLIDDHGMIVEWNGSMEKITGLPAMDAKGKQIWDIQYRLIPPDRRMPDVLEKYRRLFTHMLEEGKPPFDRSIEMAIMRADGTICPISQIIFPITLDDGVWWGTIVEDISSRKAAEKLLRESLREKELLLKEIHHRVKNNLQVVSSMLSLQSSNVRDPEVALTFKSSQDRIKSMALIHEKLYQSGDLSRIDFGMYVQNLATHLMRSYNPDYRTIKLNIDVNDILLGVDLAIPCGLVINELISNSLKYAFADRPEGQIGVSMRREGKQYWLTISDDGVGIPDAVDYRNTATLGLQLVNTLIDQLEGSIYLKRDNGTMFVITFTE